MAIIKKGAAKEAHCKQTCCALLLHYARDPVLCLAVHVQALMDTMLVLGIVVASGGLLFGLNVLLAEISDFWYHISR